MAVTDDGDHLLANFSISDLRVLITFFCYSSWACYVLISSLTQHLTEDNVKRLLKLSVGGYLKEVKKASKSSRLDIVHAIKTFHMSRCPKSCKLAR